MTKLRALFAAAAIATLATSFACGSDGTDCADGLDNDGDGYIDDGDPGCEINGDFEAPDPDFKACSDAVDNDGDGAIDTEDPGCQDSRDDDEYNEPIAACKNGQDDDEDGLTDFPADPGCSLTLDDIEGDDCPDGASCPACSNGQDDDGDGDADYPDDRGCNSAADPDEFNADPNICGANVSIQPLPSDGAAAGVFETGAVNELISPDCGGSGEEVVYVYEPTEPRALTITTDFPETTADTVVYVRTDCRMIDTEIACNDDSGLNVSTLHIERVEPGTYYIVVDSHDNGTAGDYRLQVTTYAPQDVACDPAAPDCAPGLVCRGDAGSETCQAPECRDGTDNDGDGAIDFPDEPGCSDTEDNDETDDCPSGAGCPLCSDDVDNDDDGLTDYPDDPGCTGGSDDLELDNCIPGVPLIQLTDAGASGTTPPFSAGSNFNPSCGTWDDTTEDVYAYSNNRDLLSLSFSTLGSPDDTLLAIRQGTCGDEAAEIACEDGALGETATVPAPVQDIYYVFVDGSLSSELDYVLGVSGVVAVGASCDAASTQFVCEPGATCSGGICAATACNDGMDNDGDTLADAADPGCFGVEDVTEDPDPNPLPECADGVDNDSDGQIDYPADTSCGKASDDLELSDCATESDPLLELTSGAVTGTTAGASDDDFGACQSVSTAPDVAYEIFIPGNLTAFHADTDDSSFDTVLYLRTPSCASADLACDDDDGEPGTQSSITLGAVPAGLYYLYVDGYSSNSGSYNLNVSGTIASGQPCDPAQTFLSCAAGTTCTGGMCQ